MRSGQSPRQSSARSIIVLAAPTSAGRMARVASVYGEGQGLWHHSPFCERAFQGVYEGVVTGRTFSDRSLEVEVVRRLKVALKRKWRCTGRLRHDRVQAPSHRLPDRQGTIAEGAVGCDGGLKIARYPTPPRSLWKPVST